MFKQIVIIAMLLDASWLYADAYDMLIYARSGKKSYVQDEAIGIELKLKKDAYIYFVSVGKNNKSSIVMPNKMEAYNFYKKQVNYTVPEVSADYKLIPVSSGVEKFYVIANPKKLLPVEVQNIIKTELSKKIPTQSSGIVAMPKKPPYDVMKINIIIYPKHIDADDKVEIAQNPYGSSEGYYPVDNK